MISIRQEWLEKILDTLVAMMEQINKEGNKNDKSRTEILWSFRRSVNFQKMLEEKWSEISSLENAVLHAAGINKEQARLIRPIYSAENICDMILNNILEETILKKAHAYANLPCYLMSTKFQLQFKTDKLYPKYDLTKQSPTPRKTRWLSKLSIPEIPSLYECKRYERLKQHVFHHQLFTDLLLFKDVKNYAADDDHYFVFEDFLHQILLIMSRDVEITQFAYQKNDIPTLKFTQVVTRNDGVETTQELPYPPCGMIPFSGISLMLAPICYVFNDPMILYLVFKQLYCDYFIKLHSISFENESILGLCLNVEQRLVTLCPFLLQHFEKLDIHLTKLIFPWIFSGFSGQLPPEEFLQLWDLVIERESLFPLADLTVGIFKWRETTLMSCDEAFTIEACLKNFESISVRAIFIKYFS